MEQSIKRINFGIDLGNSNVSVAYRVIAGDEFVKSQLIELDPKRLNAFKFVLPAAVFFPHDDREPVVGHDTKKNAASEGMLFTNFKGELLDDLDITARVDRNLTKTSEDALAEIFKYLFQRIVNSDDLFGHTKEAESGRRILDVDYSVTVGVPAQSSEKYRDRLTRAMVAAGWFPSREAAVGGSPKRLLFLSEPVGAILNFPHPGNKQYLVYDHGGATLDVADVTTHDTGPLDFHVGEKKRPTLSWQGEETNLGGTFLDRLLLSAAVADLDAVLSLMPHIAQAYGNECDPEGLEGLIRRAERVEENLPEHDAYRRLCADMEKVRIQFSGSARTNMEQLVLEADEETGVVISRPLVDKTFKPVSEAIKQCLVTLREDRFNGQQESEKVTCILAGGVSLTPFFVKAIEEAGFSSRGFSSDVSPFTAIATGLAQYYRGGIETVRGNGGDVTDTDYGMWIERDQRWEIVVPQKTPYIQTRLPPEGTGISKRFRPYPPTDEITLRVGQRIKERWVDLGSRDVSLLNRTGVFRVYFSIDPDTGRLELRLEDPQSKRLIEMSNPFFDTGQ